MYFQINEKELESVKSIGIEEAKKIYGNEWDSEIIFPDATFGTAECYVDENNDSLVISGGVLQTMQDIGYLSLEIPIKDIEKELIEYFLNKFDRLKTALNALS